MAAPINQPFYRFLDDFADLPLATPDHTQNRPPQLNTVLLRSRHCGCKCGASRGLNHSCCDGATGVEQQIEQDWVHVRTQDHLDYDNAGNDQLENDGLCPYCLYIFSNYSIASPDSDMTDSMEANDGSTAHCSPSSTPYSSPAESITLDAAMHSMADSTSSLPAAGSGFLHGTGGLTENFTFVPFVIDDI